MRPLCAHRGFKPFRGEVYGHAMRPLGADYAPTQRALWFAPEYGKMDGHTMRPLSADYAPTMRSLFL